MAPKPGKSGVKYLQYEGNYLIYVHPKYIAKHGSAFRFARDYDLKKAKDMARKANLHWDGHEEIITGKDKLFNHAIKRYEEEYLPTKNLATKTLKETKSRLSKLKDDLGIRVTKEMEVEDIANYLDDNFFNTQYVKYRTTLIDVFKFALTKGLARDNPALPTLPRSTKRNDPKQRERLTLEGYEAVYDSAEQWLKNAMDLSLLTLQSREEICGLRKKPKSKNIYYTDPPEWVQSEHPQWLDELEEGHIYIIRGKTAKSTDRAFIRIKISDIEGLQAVISRCNDGIVSPYLIHRSPEKRRLGKKKHWTQVLPDYLTSCFAKSRKKSGYYSHLEARQCPTYHEIRSTGGDRYLGLGYSKEFVNFLYGHTTMEMSNYYLSGHRINWTKREEKNSKL